MNRNMLIGIAIGLVVGLFIGYQAGSPAGSSGGTQMAPLPAAGFPAPVDNFQSQITQLQQLLARDPKNAEAWIQLGNDYYDSRQPQKAIEAYDRALEIKPNNADVLTDQGTMYRDLGQFDKALVKFQKANEVDPKHLQSLFNLGVVYLNDLSQPKKAIDAWNKIIERAPQSDHAAKARIAIEEAKKKSGG